MVRIYRWGRGEEELCGRRVVPAFLGALADFFEKILVSK